MSSRRTFLLWSRGDVRRMAWVCASILVASIWFQHACRAEDGDAASSDPVAKIEKRLKEIEKEKEAADAKIAELEGKIQTLRDKALSVAKKAEKNKKTPEKGKKALTHEQKWAEAKQKLADLERGRAILQKTYGRAQGELRRVNERIARLREPLELLEAWDTYKDSKQSPHDLNVLCRYVLGRPANNTELKDRKAFAIYLHRHHILPKYIGPAAEMLVGAGSLINALAGILGGGLSSATSAFGMALDTAVTTAIGEATGHAAGLSELHASALRDLYALENRHMKHPDGREYTVAEVRAIARKHVQSLRDGTLDCLNLMPKLIAAADKGIEECRKEVQKLEVPFRKLQEEVAALQAKIKPLQEKLARLDAEKERLEKVEKPKAEWNQTVKAAGKGKMIPRHVSLSWTGGAQGMRLAADDLSASVLGLPRSREFTATVVYDLLTPSQRAVDGYTINTMRRVRGGVSSRPGAAQIQVGGLAVVVDKSGTKVNGSAPGCAKLVAMVSGAASEWKRQPVPNLPQKLKDAGYKLMEDAVAKTGTLRFENQYGVSVHKITGFVAEPSREDLDLWVGHKELGSVDITARIVVDSPKEDNPNYRLGRNANKHLSWKLSGDTGSFRLHMGNSFRPWKQTLTAVGPGLCTVEVGLLDKNGKICSPTSILVQAAEPRARANLELPEIPSPHPLLPIGEEGAYVAEISGCSLLDEANYEVRWSLPRHGAGAQASLEWLTFQAKTPLERKGDMWTSTCRFTADKGAMLKRDRNALTHNGWDCVRGGFRLDAAIHRLDEAEPITPVSTFGKAVRCTLPRVRNMRLGLLGTGNLRTRAGSLGFDGAFRRVGSMDVFFPRPFGGGGLGRFGYTLDHSAGRITMEIGSARTAMLGAASSAMNGPNYLRTATRKSYNLPSSAIGLGTLSASYSASQAAKAGLVLKEDVETDQILLFFNKLVVNRIGSGADRKYRLTVYGPTNCSSYTAQWHMKKGGQVTTVVKPGPGGHVSETAPGDDTVTKVELVNPRGQVVAEHVPKRDGAIRNWPSIAVFARDHDRLKLGAAVTVGADLVNVKSDLGKLDDRLGEFRVRWEVDPEIGAFDPVESVGKSVFWMTRTKSTLKLKDTPTLAGRRFTVTGRLMRQVSDEWVEVAKAALECGIAGGDVAPPPVPDPGTGSGIGVVKIQSATVISGTNPFNPDQPVANKDGRTFQDVETMLDDGQAQPAPGVDGGLPAAITGAYAGTHNFAMDNDDGWAVGLGLDPTTGVCRVVTAWPAAAAANMLVLRNGPGQAAYGKVKATAGPGGVWRLAGGPASRELGPGTHQVELVATNGLRVRANFALSNPVPEGRWTLQIRSITRVP